jgi:hypothetical protein
MDRDEALKLLRGGMEGVAEWNQRREAGDEIPDLSGVELSNANLYRADLRRIDLSGANLSLTRFVDGDLSDTNLRHATIHHANLSHANLSGADLRVGQSYLTNFCGANLSGADLSGTALAGANLYGANLSGANPSHTSCGATIFADVDLTDVKGLDSVRHAGPSTVGIDTVFRSKGKIPEAFLRGCGLSPWEVLSTELYKRELTPPGLADLQCRIFDAWTKGRSLINGCFISYSWKDAEFVDQLRDRLMSADINVWLDRHDMVAGTIQDQVWRAIQMHHAVIIVLANDSVNSDWVENELDMARNKEKAEGRAVLCPLAVDDAWKAKVGAKDGPGDANRQLWRTLAQKLVLDFSEWKTGTFDVVFQKLVRGLNTNYRPS